MKIQVCESLFSILCLRGQSWWALVSIDNLISWKQISFLCGTTSFQCLCLVFLYFFFFGKENFFWQTQWFVKIECSYFVFLHSSTFHFWKVNLCSRRRDQFLQNRLVTGQAVEVGRNALGWAASRCSSLKKASSKDSVLNNAITKHKRENMNPSHQNSQLMRNSDTASDQWSMSGLTTHCPSQARAKTDNSDGKMTQKLSWTVQIKTDGKIVLKFPISLLPHNYHATQLPARCTSTKRRTGSRKQFQAGGLST